MGDPSGSQQPLCPCGFRGSYKTMGLCSECYKKVSRSNPLFTNPLSAPLTSSNSNNIRSGNRIKSRVSPVEGGKMDSKHFPSRSTTDNLPSSLSTPGERAGLTSGPTAPVDTQSVATSSTSTNTMSTHLPTSCNTSSPADIASHSSAASADSGAEPSRLPPTPNDSETSSSTCSDKSFDPKFDSSSLCSSNSCSSLASSISAVISSSSIGHNTDECFASDFQAKSLPSAVTSSLSQTVTDSPSSIVSVPGQNLNADSNKDAKTVTIGAVNSTKATDAEEQLVPKLPNNTFNTNAKSLSPSNQTADSPNLLKDKSSISDVSSQSSPSKGIKRTHDEMEATNDVALSPEPSPQKNKKRCFVCSCKLELAQRTIGKCRCDRIFCPVHRLPELHDCRFNHKEDGRREAREKMVKPTRHMGTSFRRDDHS